MNRSNLVFYFLSKKFGYNFSKMYDFVMENQYWSKEQIEKYQTEQMKRIIQHAYDNTIYYHEIMADLGLTPKAFHSLQDLKILPSINKNVINANYEKFLAKDYKKYKPLSRTTSGTTGNPLLYYNDPKSWALNWATKLRTYEWGNYQFGDDFAAIMKGGSMLRKSKKSLKTKLWFYLQNHKYYPIIHLTDEIMENHYHDMLRNKLKIIRGYPTALGVYAEYLHSTGKSLPMKGSFTTAEVLSKENKDLIEKVFKTKHIDAYGCGDGMAGANQCEVSDQYHINIETSFMEIVHDNIDCQDNEEGDVLLTSFEDYAMPFIRYNPGDRAIKGDDNCQCGRGLPTLRKIVGRNSDIIKLANGRVFNGISIPIEDWGDRIEKFQFVQEASDYIVLKIVEKQKMSSKDVTNIRNIMIDNLGVGIKFDLNIVKEIPLQVNGKFKFVISKLNK